MEKSQFLGITILGPTDSIYDDNAAFINRDRVELDRAGQIGVKTHRHTGLPGLSNPLIAPSAEVVASGGTIPSDLIINVGYTLQDDQRGETELSPIVTVSTPSPLSIPQIAPSAALDYSAGNLLTNSYYYAITYLDGDGGETPLGPAVIAEREPGFPNGRVILTNLTPGMEAAGAVAWRLYRSVGGGLYGLLAEGDSSEDEFTDDGSASPDCSVHPPGDTVNTTNQVSRLFVTLPSEITGSAAFINLYGTITGDFIGASLLGQYPVASAGETVEFTKLDFLDSSPPDVNRSYGGAGQIDPDTEILDWHWKRPVASFKDLPEDAEEGDVRAILKSETPLLAEFINGEWQLFEGGGGGGGSATMRDVLTIDGIAPHQVLDGFNGSEIDAGWSFILGAYEFEEDEDLAESEGALHPSAKGSKGAIFRNDAEYANGSFLFKFRMNTTPGFANEIGVFPKWVDKDNYIEQRLIWVEGAEGSSFEFFCFVGGKEIVFGSGKWANELQPDTDYWVLTEVNGAVLKVIVYDEDPTEGEPTPFETFEHTLSGEETPLIDILGFPGVGLNGETSLHLDFFQMSVPGLSYADDVQRAVFVASGGLNVSVEQEGNDAVITLDAPLQVSGMGVIIIKASEKGIPRPDDFRVYTWFCKEEPTNLGEFDIWVEEGP